MKFSRVKGPLRFSWRAFFVFFLFILYYHTDKYVFFLYPKNKIYVAKKKKKTKKENELNRNKRQMLLSKRANTPTT